ncbi:polymorphic toxin type 44 domain-containing protein [Pseudomonas sp. LAM2023]|uniref:polymorphic toxin type 44 domain-containing protein n=1 Tax=Pseudomonas sp. LAM2023 TaxID=2800477 RepID=UPI002D80DF38|nr:polymorphic toxin type 44 domain-containing protein [Pseudomonas sp. LAM2023]
MEGASNFVIHGRPAVVDGALVACGCPAGANRQDRPWDHKLAIAERFGGVWQKQGEVDFYYDIWSNIHYGYVGRAGGFSESVLLDGAGLEQISSDSIRKVRKWDEHSGPHRSADIEGLRAWDDIGDRVAISIGVKLHEMHPSGGITAKILMAGY